MLKGNILTILSLLQTILPESGKTVKKRLEFLGVGSKSFLEEVYISRATRRASEITKGA